MDWRFVEGVPIYSQIINQMRTCIAGGELGPGDKVPSVRELAVGAGVNPNTMQKALAELEREGLLHSERTSGRYVTEDARIISRMKQELSSEIVREMFESLMKIGMTRDEIVSAVTVWSDREDRPGERSDLND